MARQTSLGLIASAAALEILPDGAASEALEN
jgi:hypothetical protein